MATPKKYFHDHFVLALLSVNAFLTVASTIIILTELASKHTNTFFVQCRNCSDQTAIGRFIPGSAWGILGLVAFALLVMAVHTVLSLRVYRIHRQLSIAILALGTLLLTLTIIVGNSLLALR